MGGMHSRLQCYCCLLLLMHIELHRLSTLHSIMIVETACWACTCTYLYKLVLLQISRWWPCEPYTAHPAAVFVGDNESRDHSHSSHCWRCLDTQTIPDKVPAWGNCICMHIVASWFPCFPHFSILQATQSGGGLGMRLHCAILSPCLNTCNSTGQVAIIFVARK